MTLSNTDRPGPAELTAPPPSAYADQMPKLEEFAALPPDHPRRAVLRDSLVVAFQPIVVHLVRRYTRDQPDSREDLEQTGMMALIKAIDRWDPGKARGEFLGYLIPCVRGEIRRWFRDQTWALHVPRRLKDLGVAVGHASTTLAQELGRAPRPSELAAHLGVTVDEVIEALDALANHHAHSMDADDPESGVSVADQLGAVDTTFERIEYEQALRPLLDALPPRERSILVMRFFGDRTQSEIARDIGISQMHVSRLLSRTLAHLRRALTEEGAPQRAAA